MPTETRSTQFWAGVEQGKLLLQTCTNDHLQYPPGPTCRTCNASAEQWSEASGVGRLESFSTVERAPTKEFAQYTPYTLALVQLAEGPMVETWLIAAAGSDYHPKIGDPVRIATQQIAGRKLPIAVPELSPTSGSAE